MRKDTQAIRLATALLLAAAAAGARAGDGYIEATGSQAVSLGRKMTPATRWEVDFALTDCATTQQRVFGVSSGNGQLALYVNGSGEWSFGAKAGGYTTSLRADEERHLAVGDAQTGKGYIVTGGETNGISVSVFAVAEESDYPLAVFGYASNAGGTSFGNFAKARVYGFRVWENGELVASGVPAVKDDLPCFRDEVSGGFYTNCVAGTKLSWGGDVEQLDAYIRADGMQFIDTGYRAKTVSRFELDYEIDPTNAAHDAGGSVQSRLFSASESAAVTTVYVAGTAGGSDANIAFSCGDAWSGTWTGKGFDATRRTVVLDVENAKGILLEQGVAVSDKTIGRMTADSAETLRLFSTVGGNGRKGYNLAKMKVYSFRILENGSLVHDYRPAVRDGVAGLLDAVGGGFLAPAPMGRPFLYGGPVDTDGSDGACLVSSGDQIVNTSLIPKLVSRIEVDFALNSHTGRQERIFGATKATDSPYGLYCNGSVDGAGNFSFMAGDVVSGAYPIYDTGVAVDLKRHKAVIDYKNAELRFETGAATDFVHAIDAAVNAPTWIMGLFGEPYSANFSGTDNRAAVRIFSAKVYNNDVLVQHWLPYRDGASIGLKDVVTGTVRTDGRAAAEKFRVSGCGWGEERRAFYDNPSNGVVSAVRPVTVSAYAPGAVAYQWLVDGVAAEGATDSVFQVVWRRSETPVPVSALAYFNVGDAVVSRESAPAMMKMATRGFMMVVK